MRLPPVVLRSLDDRTCPLAWDELLGAAPPAIPLTETRPWDCAALASAPCDRAADETWCVRAPMHGGRIAELHGRGPEGSGRFVQLALVVEDVPRRYACLDGSTVGWRALLDHAAALAPLPWLADLDGDREAEIVLWQRLPWGSAEVTNALYPVPYALSGNQLVRRDDRAAALRARVAAAYREAATAGTGFSRCFDVLGRLDELSTRRVL